MLRVAKYFETRENMAIFMESDMLFHGVKILVISTPIVMLPWSHFLLRSIYGPSPANKRLSRIGMTILVTAGITLANYAVAMVELFIHYAIMIVEKGFIAH